MQELVIDITSGGKVEAMNVDKFSLRFLGAMKIARATEIMFDESSQSWYITDPDKTVDTIGGPLSGFSDYDEARGFEVEWMNECRLQQLEPFSEEGYTLAYGLRSGQ